MTVRDTSLMAFEELLKRLEPAEQAVFEILEEIGPACDRRILEALNQKEEKSLKPKHLRRYWEINQVCGRRNGLVNLGVIRDMGIYVGIWYGKKKKYHFWKVAGDIRQPAGWEKYEKKIKYQKSNIKIAEVRLNKMKAIDNLLRDSRDTGGERPATASPMDVHTAGRVMVEWRRQGKRRINQPTKQLVMF
jgi:hypothetical protein